MADQTEREELAQTIDAAFTPDGRGITLHQGTPTDLADALLAAGYRKVTEPVICSHHAQLTALADDLDAAVTIAVGVAEGGDPCASADELPRIDAAAKRLRDAINTND